MTAWLLAGGVLVTALVTFLGARWYYGRKAGELEDEVSRAEGAGEALKVERAARSSAEAAAIAATEARWEQEAKEAAGVTSVDDALSRWGRTYRRLGVPQDD